MTQRHFDAVVARGRALPENRRLAYVESPTPTTTRWVFQNSTRGVCVGISAAEAYIASVEAEVAARNRPEAAPAEMPPLRRITGLRDR
jgi:hypothetical protein